MEKPKRTVEQRKALQKFCKYLFEEVCCAKFTEEEIIQIYEDLEKKVQGDLYMLRKGNNYETFSLSS